MIRRNKLNLPLTALLLLVSLFAFTCILNQVYRPKTRSALKPDTLSAWTSVTIPSGGSLYSVLEKSGVPIKEVGLFALRFGEQIDITSVQPGDTVRYKLSPDRTKFEHLIYIQEIDEQHHFRQKGDSLSYQLIKLPVTVRTRLLRGTLDSNLNNSLLRTGLTPSEKQQIINALEAKIDFRKLARQGDSFQVLAEERFYGDLRLPKAKILYVRYSGKLTGDHELFRYEDGDEKSILNGLYDPDGKRHNPDGIGFPLHRIHVISGFGKRIDPIYGDWRMHQGVDYLAAYGTPVKAVAGGVVTASGWNGGYGYCVVIKHPAGFSTMYAHLSSTGVRKGQTVKKGQTIGRAGSSGKSTGPHLHFALLQGNRYINPNRIKMVSSDNLTPAQMKIFRQQMEQIRRLLAEQSVS